MLQNGIDGRPNTYFYQLLTSLEMWCASKPPLSLSASTRPNLKVGVKSARLSTDSWLCESRSQQARQISVLLIYVIHCKPVPNENNIVSLRRRFQCKVQNERIYSCRTNLERVAVFWCYLCVSNVTIGQIIVSILRRHIRRFLPIVSLVLQHKKLRMSGKTWNSPFKCCFDEIICVSVNLGAIAVVSS